MRRAARRRGGTLLLAVTGLVASGAARAASGPPVRLRMEACVPVSHPDVGAMLALELERSRVIGVPDREDDGKNDGKSDGQPGGGQAGSEDGGPQVIVDCLDSHAVRVTVDRAAGRRQQRHVRLYDVPPRARPRLLALAIVELLAAGGPAPEPAPPAGAPRTVTAPLPAVVAVPPGSGGPSPPSWRAGAGASGRSFSSAWGQATFGAAAGVTRELPGPRAAIALDVAVEASERAASLGRVAVLLASAALWYELRGQHGRWTYGAGPGLRLGWARLAGAAPASQVQAHTVSRWWTGPLLAARLDVDLTARLSAGAALEAGKVLQSVRGLVGDSPEVEIGGAWLAATIFAGTRW